MKLKFGIVGFGEVGATVGSLLNTNFKNSSFYIYEPDIDKRGRILDFSHACAVKQNNVFLNKKKAFETLDFIIYCAGVTNKVGEERNSVSDKNKKIVFDLFENIQLSEQCKIIVVTNPVENVCFWIHSILKKNTIIGTGTSLDTYRLNYILAEHTNSNINQIESLVIGEHSSLMMPIFSLTNIQNENVKIKFRKEELYEIQFELKNSATKIRETETATKYGVSECVISIVKALLKKESLEIPISILVNAYYKEMLSIQNEVFFISLPCIIDQGKITIKNIVLEEEEKECLKDVVEKMKKNQTN